MGYLLPVHHSGFGVRSCSFFGISYLRPIDFVVSRVSPDIQTALGYKMFLMFASINIGALATFALYMSLHLVFSSLMLMHVCLVS
jgi:hypothetical protein